MNKFLTILSILILINIAAFAQPEILMNNSGIYTTCDAKFYDGGGVAADYITNQNVVVTIKPATAGAKLSVNFSSFRSSENQDFLYVYNGNDTTKERIGLLTGLAGYGTITSTAADGSLTFKFVSDNVHVGVTNEAGWDATISCSSAPPDTVTMIASGTVTTCGGKFYDGGGAGDYMIKQNSVLTLYPSTAGAKLSVNFSSFRSSENQDFLYVYNGNDTTAARIKTLTGQSGTDSIISSATDGSLTFKFVSDNVHVGVTNEAGWDATISCGAGSTTSIAITSSQIPPWQRENDELVGNIKADYSNLPVGSKIQLDIYVNGTYAGTPASTVWATTGPSGTHQFDFNILASSLNPKPKKGDLVGYQLINNSSGAHEDVAQLTNIIDSQWTNQNAIYYNSGTNQLLIPLKYFSNTISTTISFVRKAGTSHESENIVSAPVVQFENNKYFVLDPTNSSLQTVSPGVFDYNITYNPSSFFNESGTFDLTKIGILKSFSGNDTLVVLIGGNRNKIEDDFKKLNGDPDKDFSIAENFNSGFISSINASYNTWYVSQSNTNYFENNAYDIGLALDSINAITARQSVSPSQIHLIAHSFGGLQLRAMLSGLSKRSDGETSVVNPEILAKIKSVTFLSTPHRGISMGSWQWIDGNAYLQARNNSQFFIALNNKTYPSKINFLNITGIDDSYISPSDGIVPAWSSEYPIMKNTSGSRIPILQSYVKKWVGGGLYNIFNPFLSTAHSMTHHSKTVSNLSYSIPNNYSTLNRIFSLIRGQIVEQIPTVNYGTDVIVNNYGSILSGSKFSIKYSGDVNFNLKTIADENGAFSMSFFSSLKIGDSIKIEAAGYESLILAVDSNILLTGKIDIAMLKSLGSTNKIKYPSLKLVEQNPITPNKTVSIEATAQNVLNFQINSPFNQDSIFVPLTLNNNQFTSQLDTGYNLILVRFIGQQDTVTLAKDVYYLPDSLLTQYTYNTTIIANTASIGTKMYVNNQFVKQINSLNEIIPVLSGQNILRFSKFGYVDSLITIDSAATINLSLQLFPYSYSSISDSSIIDFPSQGRIQYRRNVTMLDSAKASIISLKQFDDNFPGMGLIPQSRKFEFRHLNAPAWSDIKTAIVLDQVATLSPDSIYLMKISNDTGYTKIKFDTTGLVAAYDSVVQKLTYNYINFDNGSAMKEALVIMKKQAPIARSIAPLSIKENDSLIIPLSTFFSDPDSIHNDMEFQIPDTNPPGLHLSITNGNVIVNTIHCYSGNTSFAIRATHDGLTVSKTVDVSVTALAQPLITASGLPTICLGDSITLTSSGASSYSWSTGATSQSIVTTTSGNYQVTTTDAAGCINISEPFAITVNQVPEQPATITGNSRVAVGQSINYAVDSINAATEYNWSLSGGGIITNGQKSKSVFIDWTTFGNYTLSIAVSNDCGNSLAQTITISVSSFPDNPFEIKIFPNPSPGEFYATAKGLINKNIEIEVLNALGQSVYRFQQSVNVNEFNRKIDLKKMTDGIYFLKILVDNKPFWRKIVKRN